MTDTDSECFIADKYWIVSEQESIEIGKGRQGIHPNGTRRFFDDPNTEDILGVKAELAFSQMTKIPMDREFRAAGDGCIDFMVPLGDSTELVSLDVKGARTPYNLFVKEPDIKRCADILVLAGVDSNKVWFLGWEHKSIMRRMSKRDFGYKIVNYFRSFKDLRPMSQLIDMIEMGKRAIEAEQQSTALKRFADEHKRKDNK